MTGDMHRSRNSAAVLRELTSPSSTRRCGAFSSTRSSPASVARPVGFAFWMRLRLTADGLRILGEWPPTEGAIINQPLAAVRAPPLAPELPDDDATASPTIQERAVAKMSAATVLDVFKDQARRLREDALGWASGPRGTRRSCATSPSTHPDTTSC